MTFDISVLIDQMKIIATLMAIGVIWQKTKLLDDNLINSLSAIIAKLILPFMLCTIIGSVSKDEISKSGRLLLASVLYYSVILFVSILLSKFGKTDPLKRKLDILLKCYGNSGFIGIPLIVSIFAEEAGLIAAAITIVEVIFYWVVGPMVIGRSKKIDAKKLITPFTVSVVLGCIFMVLPFDLNNNLVWQTAKNVGGTCKYFASIYIGMAVARIDIHKLKSNLSSCLAIPIKLIVAPIIAYFLIGKTGLLSGENLTMMIMLTATPAGMMLPLVAEFSGYDKEYVGYVSVGLTVSTVCCLFTMPLVMWLIEMF